MALLGDEPTSAPTTYVALNDELFELYCTGRLRIPTKYKGHFPRRGFRLINTDKDERAEGAAVWGGSHWIQAQTHWRPLGPILKVIDPLAGSNASQHVDRLFRTSIRAVSKDGSKPTYTVYAH